VGQPAFAKATAGGAKLFFWDLHQRWGKPQHKILAGSTGSTPKMGEAPT